MVLLESLPLESTEKMPDFEATDAFEKSHTLSSCMGNKGLVIVFTCNHCPYAKAIWGRCIALYDDLKTLGISMVAINPNIHPGYPDDSVEAMQSKVLSDKIPFPYLVDKTQDIARDYQAQCTPDIYLLSADQYLFYHGRLDDNWQDASAVTKQDLLLAAQLLAAGSAPPKTQHPSLGCSIKWLD